MTHQKATFFILRYHFTIHQNQKQNQIQNKKQIEMNPWTRSTSGRDLPWLGEIDGGGGWERSASGRERRWRKSERNRGERKRDEGQQERGEYKNYKISFKY